MDLDSEDVHDGVIDVDNDDEDSDDEDIGKTTSLGSELFSAPQQVFIVKSVSKATSGFRPSVTCEGFLAELTITALGYALSPVGSDQQLSFKYEPPSPKFSRKRPSCISYRLQLLHGSQFLYSLRGLPKVLKYQRKTKALEWGPVHMVFSASSDLDTFLTTLKHVEMLEIGGPQGESPQQAALPAPASAATTVGAAATAVGAESGVEAGGPAAGPGMQAVEEKAAGTGVSTERSLQRAQQQLRPAGDSGMQWAEVAARLLAESEKETSPAKPAPSAEPAAAAKPVGGASAPHLHSPPYSGTLLAATAGVAVLVAALATTYLLSRRGASRRQSGA